MDKIYKGRIGGEIEQYTPPATLDTHPAQWGQVLAEDAKRLDLRASNLASDLSEAEKTAIKNKLGVVEGSGGTGSGVTKRYLTWAALLADQGTHVDLGIYFAEDASGFSTVDAGGAYFEYLGTTNGTEADYRKLSEEESMDVVASVGNPVQQTLTDAATVSWDLATEPLAILTATGAVGSTRTIPDTVISSGANGAEYSLTFVQDATGNKIIEFGSKFNVIGEFDLAPNRRTILTVKVQGDEADVVLTALKDAIKPQALTGTQLDLSSYEGNTYNYNAASSAEVYTVSNLTVLGYAVCLINAANEPVVTSGMKIAGSPFQANVNMEMVVRSMDGVNVQYYFIAI